MPAAKDTGGARREGRRGFSYRALPLWVQWALPFTAGGALIAVMVWFVNHETYSVPALANVTSRSAIVEQNREARVLVEQQQAPHEARLRPGESAVAGMRAAVVRYMARQIAVGAMDGPIKRVSCSALAGAGTGRELFRCRVTASALLVTYPFDGVVAPASGRITYCQRVTPPIPSMNIPVSRRCT